MNTYPPGFFNSQTRCHIAKIVRTDGVIYGFTDTLIPLSFGGVDFLPIDGILPSAVTQESGMRVDNFELTTLNNPSLNRIKTDELMASRYHGARAWLFEIDWMTPAAGAMILGQWRFAKCRIGDSSYALEALDLLSLANNQQGEVLNQGCPVQRFGDQRCDPLQTIRALNTFATAVLYPVDLFTVDVTDTRASGFYTQGDFLWTSGPNTSLFGGDILRHTKITPAAWGSGTTYAYGDYAIGSDTRVYISLKDANTNHNPNANGNPTWWYQLASSPASLGRVQFRLPIPYTPVIGDALNMCKGCARIPTACAAFANAHNASGSNIENYQGEFLATPSLVQQVARMSG